MEADGMMRLDKFLAKMGAGSRQEVKSYIRKGMVSVNGETVSRPETKIDEEKDEIFLQGKRIAYAAFEYYMLNKPAGVISATEDKKETTVVDLIREKKRKDLFPVGRLDKDTEGLLLITNDGVLAHRLLFSILFSLAEQIPGLPLSARLFLLPSLEMTTGVRYICSLELPFPVRYASAAFLTSFGGFCCLAQTASILKGTPLKIMPYFAEKLVTAAATSFLSCLFLLIF